MEIVGAHVSEVFEFRGYRLDPARRSLETAEGQPVALRPRAFDVLHLLVRHAGEPVTKAQILAEVWSNSVVEDNTLNQVVSTLRQILGDDRRNPSFIATVTGRGYQFVAPVHVTAEPTLESAGNGTGAPATAALAEQSALSRAPAVQVPTESGPTVGQPGRRKRADRSQGAMTLTLLAVILGGLTAIAIHLRPLFEADAGAHLTNAQLVTDFPGSHSQPTVSPDGSLMAFVSDASARPQLWVKTLPDGLPRQLTSGEAPATAPSWSPTGDAILFERPTAEGFPGAWLIEPLGSKPPRLLVSDARRPRFSQSGDAFTFSRGFVTHVASLDGRTIAPLKGAPELDGFAEPMPVMNARGDVALVLAEEGPIGDLWWYRAVDGRFARLTRGLGRWKGVWARAPVWLPGGESLLYVASQTGEPTDAHLWLTDVGDGRSKVLTSGVGGYAWPAISDDGSRLVYAHQRPMWRLIATDMDTGEHRVIHASREGIHLPMVSADGEEIVYFGEHVFTIPVAGGKPQQRTFGPRGQATLPTWSRGADEHIYYYRDRELHRLKSTTAASELVLKDFHWRSQNWLAVHPERLAYAQQAPGGPAQHTVIIERATGERLIIDDPVLAPSWSRSGKRLLGHRRNKELVICHAPRFECEPILHDGEPIRGARPTWSIDERRIIFRKAQFDRPGYAWIWAVDRTGDNLERIVEIGPYDPMSMYLGVGEDNTVIWNEYDAQGRSEIWMAELKGLDLGR